MDLQKLRAFSVIAAEGNITRAARRLSTSQPAVSKQLAELEEAVGTALFHRLPRGVRLTEAGEILQRHAARIFAAESAAEAELAELSGLTRGRLSVGASITIGNYLIPHVFSAFHREYPQVKLELEIANTSVIQAMVLDDRVDLGLTEGFVAREQLATEAIHYDEMVAIAAPGHPLLAQKSVRARELANFPFISRERGSGTRDVIEAALHELGVDLEPAMALGSAEAIKNVIASGAGVAVVSRLAVERELAAGQLVAISVHDLRIRRALHLVRLGGKRESPAVEAFIRMLRAAL
ncbi:MAG TPA: LysR family transcriptional regulator [Polyangiaceae bacterium]|nr:LysR family transcriptional regulator [Polyangiaceae bacterium]